MAEQDRKAGRRSDGRNERERGEGERQRGEGRVASERPREKEGWIDNGRTTKEEERVHSNSAHNPTDNPIYRCIGAAGSAATKTLTE